MKGIPGVVDVRVATQGASQGTFHVDVEGGQDIRRELARTVVQGGWGLLALQSENMSLEDIFIKLTTAEETPAQTAS
jgi:ABC-2 type transport system ATP-binding protein